MAWTTIGTTNVAQTSTVLGYVYLQYDTASSGSTWAVRLITGARSGYSFNVRFDNVTVDGNNQGTKTGVTQNSVVVWSGNLSGGRSISGSWSCPWTTGTKYYSISGTLPAKGSAPSNYSATNIVAEWDRITFTSVIGNTGGLSLASHCPSIQKEPLIGGRQKYENTYNTGTIPATITSTVTNDSSPINNPTWKIQGCGFYYTGAYANNSAGALYGQGPSTYTPPAPSQFTYTDPGGGGTKTFPVTFTGVAANNNSTYDTAELNRTIRYKIDDGSWVYVDNATVAAIDFVSSFNVTVPAGSVATVEGWQTYHDEQSEVSTITLANTNQACVLYGSVNGQAKELTKVYASVNGQAKKLVKIYASVGGVAKKVYEDV